jgi:hypothetical protein
MVNTNVECHCAECRGAINMHIFKKTLLSTQEHWQPTKLPSNAKSNTQASELSVTSANYLLCLRLVTRQGNSLGAGQVNLVPLLLVILDFT